MSRKRISIFDIYMFKGLKINFNIKKGIVREFYLLFLLVQTQKILFQNSFESIDWIMEELISKQRYINNTFLYKYN